MSGRPFFQSGNRSVSVEFFVREIFLRFSFSAICYFQNHMMKGFKDQEEKSQ